MIESPATTVTGFLSCSSLLLLAPACGSSDLDDDFVDCVLYRQCLFFKVNPEMRNKLKINTSNMADLHVIYNFPIK